MARPIVDPPLPSVDLSFAIVDGQMASANGPNKAEPLTYLQQNGYDFQDYPKAENINYLFNGNYLWVEYFKGNAVIWNDTDVTASGNTIPKRTAAGQVNVKKPTANDHAVNKQYMDDNSYSSTPAANKWAKSDATGYLYSVTASLSAGNNIVVTNKAYNDNKTVSATPNRVMDRDSSGRSKVETENSNTTGAPSDPKAVMNYEAVSKLFSLQTTQPLGAVQSFMLAAPPEGWVVIDGSELNAASEPKYLPLYNAMVASGLTNIAFNNIIHLPDARALFNRNADYGRGLDPDYASRQVGDTQEDSILQHDHRLIKDAGVVSSSGYGDTDGYMVKDRNSHGSGGYFTFGQAGDATLYKSSQTGDVETRPKNISLLCCIKYA